MEARYQGVGSEERDKGLVVSLDRDGLPQDVVREFLTRPCDSQGLLFYLCISPLGVSH